MTFKPFFPVYPSDDSLQTTAQPMNKQTLESVYPSDDSLQTTARDTDVLVLDSGSSIIRQGANRRPGGHGQDDEAHPTFQDGLYDGAEIRHEHQEIVHNAGTVA